MTIDSAGVTTVQLSQAPGNTTYTVEFCAAPAQLYPNCSTVGSVTTNAAGAISSTISLPAGSWAGDFQLVRNGTIEYSTSVIAGVHSIYYATLQPNSTVNGKGTYIYGGSPPPQDPLETGSVELTSTGLIYISLTGAAPNASYSASQCPLVDGSDCYAVQTLGQNWSFTTDKNGDVTYSAGLITNLPEDIFSVGQTLNQGNGFIAGFRIP